MGYFGGGGVQDDLHPSLRAYIDCFLSNPFPKMFPRGGGVWDQDPILMRDFRFIRNFELEWKQTKEQMSKAKELSQSNTAHSQSEEGGGDLGGLLDQMLEEEGLEADGYF